MFLVVLGALNPEFGDFTFFGFWRFASAGTSLALTP